MDVDAVLQGLRDLLGSGPPPRWVPRQFGETVPPRPGWIGTTSDGAHHASVALEGRRQQLAAAHASVGPLVEQAGQVAQSAQRQLEMVQARWESDKAMLEPYAHTSSGRAALLRVGQIRVAEGVAAVHAAQAMFSGLAGEVGQVSADLPRAGSGDHGPGTGAAEKNPVQLVDFKTGPEVDPDHAPEPGGGYGSYHYGYQFSTAEGWTKEQIMGDVQKHFNNYFTFTGDKGEIVNGAKISLRGPLGEAEPVEVTSVTPDSFSFMSLPGHKEGAGRVIKFSIVPAAQDPIPGRLSWELRVAASGPLSGMSLMPGASWMNKGIWQIFADNLGSKLPSLPPGIGGTSA